MIEMSEGMVVCIVLAASILIQLARNYIQHRKARK